MKAVKSFLNKNLMQTEFYQMTSFHLTHDFYLTQWNELC